MTRRPSIVAAAIVAACTVTACGAGGTSTAKSSARDGRASASHQTDVHCTDAAGPAGEKVSAVPAGHRPQVATTVAPITSIVANVAGDRADVRGVIPEGQDSHTYEPKPSVARLFSTADVVFVNGLSLEDPTRDLAQRNIGAGHQVIALGNAALTPSQYIYDFSFPKAGGKPNPHLWTDPPMARCYAGIAADVLSRLDPPDAGYYRDNAARYVAKVDQLDQLFRAASDAMAPASRKLLTYHDAYAYFAAHYGWTVIGAIQVSSFEDPSPKEVAALIDQVKREKVPAIFGSEVFPSPVLAEIGRETGVKYVDKLRDDDLPGAPGDADHSYLGLMKADFVTMVSSLGGDATGLRAFDPADTAPDRAEYPQ